MKTGTRAEPIMARNHRGSTKRSDILAQTTVRQAGSSRQPPPATRLFAKA